MIMIKVHKTPNGDIVAVCDKNIIGKTFENKDLRITASERFYNGEEVKDEKELLKIIKNASNLNIMGKESIEFAVKNKIISKKSIIIINNVPHAIKILV